MIKKLTTKLIAKAIRSYQIFISPVLHSLLGGQFAGCRFYPSCSSYWLESVETFGLLEGNWRGLKRLIQCHPFSAGGLDTVKQIKN